MFPPSNSMLYTVTLCGTSIDLNNKPVIASRTCILLDREETIKIFLGPSFAAIKDIIALPTVHKTVSLSESV